MVAEVLFTLLVKVTGDEIHAETVATMEGVDLKASGKVMVAVLSEPEATELNVNNPHMIFLFPNLITCVDDIASKSMFCGPTLALLFEIRLSSIIVVPLATIIVAITQ